MMKTKYFLFDFVFVLILISLVILSAMYFYPYAMEIPHRDSGVFLYTSSQILKGKTLYREAWDHKPPMIYYFNALGLLIGGESGWGVWSIEVLFIALAVILSYVLIRKKAKPIPGLLITIAAYLAAFQYMSGNYTEEYALVFQVGILCIFLSKWVKSKTFSAYLLIGVLTGISFNIKQIYIDATIVIVLLLSLEIILDRRWQNIKKIIWIGVGFLIPNVIIFFVMLLNNAVRHWWNAAFIYNFAYSDIGLIEKIFSLVDIVKGNFQYPFFVYLVLAWLGIFLSIIYISIPHFIQFFYRKKGRLYLLALSIFFLILLIAGQFMGTEPGLGLIELSVLSLGLICLSLFVVFTFIIKKKKKDKRLPFSFTSWQAEKKRKYIYIFDPVLIGFFHFPIVLILASTSGRNYPHYFIPFYISLLLIFWGAFVYLKRVNNKILISYILTFTLLILFAVGAIQPIKKLVHGVKGPYSYNPFSEVVDYIKENSDEEETIMVWGIEPVINYISDRSSPSRFSYVISAYHRSPLRDETRAILLQDITSHPPKFILDTHNPEYPFTVGKNQEECFNNHPLDGSDLDKLIHYACENYKSIGRLNNIDLFEKIENP